MLDPNGLVHKSTSCLADLNSDRDLNYQLERLWKTDFEDCVVNTKVCPSIEDQRALIMMEESLKQVDNHYQVGLPWRHNPPYLLDNKEMAQRRALMLKKRLLRDK